MDIACTSSTMNGGGEVSPLTSYRESHLGIVGLVCSISIVVIIIILFFSSFFCYIITAVQYVPAKASAAGL